MITPTPQDAHQGMTPPYDPMAVRFMTQDQMQFMPEAQYLSPSQYGAFRGMPGPHQGIMPQQQMSLWQAYMTSTRGSPLGMLPDYSMASYQMGHDQSMHHVMAQRRVQDAGGVAGAMGANYGLNAALSLGLSGGNPLLMAGASAMMPDFGAPMTDRIARQREIQDMSMSRIALGPDRAEGLGQGFAAPAAADIDEFMRGAGAGDILFKEQDYREIMRTGMQEGLFDFDHSSHEYKRTIEQLRDNINIMGEILGSTDFRELTQGMRRLMTMGAELDQMGEITQTERMFSRMTGMRHDQMVSAHGQQGAMIYSQAGLTNYQGSLAAMSHAADVTMAQRLGILDPGTLARHGGVSGMTQELTQQQAMSIGQTQDYYLPHLANEDFTGLRDDFQGQMDGLLRGEIGFDDLAQGARGIQDVNDFARYEANRARIQQELQDELGPVGFQMFQRQLAQDLGSQMGGGTTEEQLMIGYREMGFDEEMSRQQAEQWSDPEFVQAQRDNLETERRRVAYSAMEQRRHEDSPLNRMAIWARESIHDLHTPYKRWRDRRDQRTQREEDARLGVHSVPGAEGMAGLGEMGYEDYLRYTEDWDLDEMIDSHLGTRADQDEVDVMLGGGTGVQRDLLRQGSVAAQPYVRRGRELRRAHGASIDSWDEFDEAIRGFDPALSPARLRERLGDIDSIEDLTRRDIEQLTSDAIVDSRDMSGFTDEQRRIYTEEIAPERATELAGDSRYQELIYGATRQASEAFDMDVLTTFEDRAREAYGQRMDDLAAFREEYSRDLRQFVGSGLFGIADREQRAMLEDLLERDPRGADLYSLQMLQVRYAREEDPGERRRLRKRFSKIARRLGWSNEQIRTTLEHSAGLESDGMLQHIQDEMGYSEEEARELLSMARETGRDLQDDPHEIPGLHRTATDQALDMADELGERQQRRAAIESAEIEGRFRDALEGAGYTADDLRDEESRQQLLQDTDDVYIEQAVQAADRLQTGAADMARRVFEDFGVDISDVSSMEDLDALAPDSEAGRQVVDAAGRILSRDGDLTAGSIAGEMTEGDLVRRISTYTAHTDSDPYRGPDSTPEHVAKEGQEETLQNLDSTIRGLHQVLHTVNDTLQQNAEVNRNVIRELQS